MSSEKRCKSLRGEGETVANFKTRTVLPRRCDIHPLGCITFLQQGGSGRLSRRSSRSTTSLQQGRSGRLSRRSSRSITCLQQGRSGRSSPSSTRHLAWFDPQFAAVIAHLCMWHLLPFEAFWHLARALCLLCVSCCERSRQTVNQALFP